MYGMWTAGCQSFDPQPQPEVAFQMVVPSETIPGYDHCLHGQNGCDDSFHQTLVRKTQPFLWGICCLWAVPVSINWIFLKKKQVCALCISSWLIHKNFQPWCWRQVWLLMHWFLPFPNSARAVFFLATIKESGEVVNLGIWWLGVFNNLRIPLHHHWTIIDQPWTDHQPAMNQLLTNY